MGMIVLRLLIFYALCLESIYLVLVLESATNVNLLRGSQVLFLNPFLFWAHCITLFCAILSLLFRDKWSRPLVTQLRVPALLLLLGLLISHIS